MKWKVLGVGLVLAVAGTAAAVAFAVLTTPITVQPKDATGTLTIPGISGGDVNGINNPMTVTSFSWGVENSGTPALHDLTVTKLIDKASPNLFLGTAIGHHFPQVTLVLNRPGATAGTPFVTYRLTDAVLTSDSQSGNGNNTPLERITFQYSRFDETYVTSDGETVEAAFDKTAG